MGKSKEYDVGGIYFPTQRDLETEVARRKAQPCNVRFRDPFLAEILNTLHVEIQASGQKSTGVFELLDEAAKMERGLGDRPGVPLLLAEFEPSGAWEPVSVTPWRRRRTVEHCRGCIKEALRELLSLYLPQSGPATRCFLCFSAENLQPWFKPGTFERIAEECLDLLTLEEVTTRLGFNRYALGRDVLLNLLPAAHPAVRHLLQSHAQFEWRCSQHRQPALDDLEVRAR